MGILDCTPLEPLGALEHDERGQPGDSLGKQGRSWTQLCPETCELARETVSAFQLGVELDLPLLPPKIGFGTYPPCDIMPLPVTGRK